MNNVSCTNCGHSISAKATVCPSCGHPHRPARSRAPLIVVLALLAVGYVVWGLGGHQQAQPSNTAAAPVSAPVAAAAPAPPPPNPGYTLNDQEERLLRLMLVDEFRTYAAGGKTLAGSDEGKGMTDAIRVTADQYQRAYDRNEVAGDKAYLGKHLVVSGRVTSIDRSVGQNYFLQLAGGTNMFMAPHAMMADGYTDYLAGLSKGQVVNLACDGDGMLMKSATLTKCVPANDWADAEASRYIANISDRVAAHDELAQLLLLSSVALASVLPATSPCFAPNPNVEGCRPDMAKFKKMDDPAPFLAAAKKLNIDLNALKKPKAPPPAPAS